MRKKPSPSARYLGHHDSPFKLGGIQYSKEKPDFSERMMKLNHIMTSIALLNESPPLWWLISIFLLLNKDSSRPNIHWIRIINTYESEYNIIIKYVWAKKGMEKVENNNWLGFTRIDGRKSMRATETETATATINKLII